MTYITIYCTRETIFPIYGYLYMAETATPTNGIKILRVVGLNAPPQSVSCDRHLRLTVMRCPILADPGRLVNAVGC